jgi:hypothetical protein
MVVLGRELHGTLFAAGGIVGPRNGGRDEDYGCHCSDARAVCALGVHAATPEILVKCQHLNSLTSFSG